MKDKGMTLAQRQERAAAVLENVRGDGELLAVTGPATELFRISALIAALRLEVKGIKMSRISAYRSIKDEFGFTGTKQQVLEKLLHYRFVNYPRRPIDKPCPQCGKLALVTLEKEDGVDMTDGTVVLCHPMLKGCNTGFAVDA